MKIGLCLPQLGAHANSWAVREFAVRAEAVGFDSLWVQEHFMVPESPKTGYAGIPGVKMPDPYRAMLSPLELLAFVAAITERAQIGTSILVTAYHRPLDLAKRLTTLDILSAGRAVAGLGLGWSRDEYDHMDTPFEHRGARMTDFVKALKACWQPDPIEYHGRFFDIPRCDSSPKPIQRDAEGRPGVPIILGGGSPAALRRTALYADGWNPAGAPPPAVISGLATIRGIAKEAGRSVPFQSWMRVFANPHLPGVAAWHGGFFAGMSWHGPVEEMVPKVEEARDAGVDHVIIETGFWEPNPDPEGWVRQVEFFTPLVAAAHK